MFKDFFLIIILIMVMGVPVLRAQQDSLVMNTGEILVGEIKGFDEGVVTIETDYSDKDFQVEWGKIVSIRTKQKFVLISDKGERLYGRLVSDKEDPSSVTIEDEAAGYPVMRMEDIVFFKEVDDTFWKRFDLKLSAGYILTKANNSHQFSGNLETGYMSNRYKGDLYTKVIRTIQTADDVTTEVSRTEVGGGFLLFIVNDWFAIARADLLQSSEMQLNLRAITKGGAGYYAVKNNRMNLGLAAGGAWNLESYDDPTVEDRNSAEAFVAAEYKIFNLGDLELNTKAIGYPSLTEKGRFRTDFDFSVEYEFGFDLFIKLGYTLNYDNQPAQGASGSDYVLETTIGWSL